MRDADAAKLAGENRYLRERLAVLTASNSQLTLKIGQYAELDSAYKDILAYISRENSASSADKAAEAELKALRAELKEKSREIQGFKERIESFSEVEREIEAEIDFLARENEANRAVIAETAVVIRENARLLKEVCGRNQRVA